MLSITWSKGTSYPQGIQDCDGGIVNGTLVATCGYSNTQTDVPEKPNKYPCGWNNATWGLNISSPQDGWQSLPNFPGAGRQELFGVTVNNELYCWGGYDGQNCFSDGYRLSQNGQGQWSWTAMPSLPWAVASSGICAIGSKIYAVGGSYLTYATNTTGDRLLSLDTDQSQAQVGRSFQRVRERRVSSRPRRPSTASSTCSAAPQAFDTTGTGSYATVVDNWQFDPATNQWAQNEGSPGCQWQLSFAGRDRV